MSDKTYHIEVDTNITFFGIYRACFGNFEANPIQDNLGNVNL